MAITNTPYEVQPAFNPVVFTRTGTTALTVTWTDAQGEEHSLTLSQIFSSSSGEDCDIKNILQMLFDGQHSAESVDGWEGDSLPEAFIDRALAQEYDMNGTKYIVTNGVVQRGESLDLLNTGTHGVLTGRPTRNGKITIPVYQGFPAGVTLMQKNTYNELPTLTAYIIGSFNELGLGEGVAIQIESNTAWTATVDTGFSLSSYSGSRDGVIFVVHDSEALSRTNYVTITTGKGQTVRILLIATDYAAEPISVSPVSIDFGVEEGSKVITVKADVDWSVDTATLPVGFSLSQTEGEMGTTEVTLTREGVSTEGSFTLTFKDAEDNEATVSVTYTADTITVSPTSHDFEAKTGAVEITVNSSLGWEVEGTLPSGFSLSASEGDAGTTKITLTRSTYTTSGSGTLTFKNKSGNATATFTFAYAASSISLSTSSYNFGAAAGSVTFNVISTSEWVASSLSGFSLNKTVGEAGTTEVILTRTADGEGSGTITFTNAEGLEVTFTVTYSEFTMSILPLSHDFGDSLGSATILVMSSTAWVVTGLPSSGFTLSATSGDAGTSTVTLTRTAVDTAGTGTLTFSNSI